MHINVHYYYWEKFNFDCIVASHASWMAISWDLKSFMLQIVAVNGICISQDTPWPPISVVSEPWDEAYQDKFMNELFIG